MSHTIRFGEARDVPAAMAFIDTHYRRGHALAHRRDLFDWQYRASDGRYNLALAIDDQSADVLGLLGFVDSKQYDATLATDNCLWLALWQVDPNARVPTLGLGLLKFLEAQVEHTSVAVSGIRAVLRPVYRALRFTVTDLSHHVLANPDVTGHQLATIPPDRARREPSRSDIELRQVTRESFPTMLQEQLAGIVRTPRKSAIYFYNRYLAHPFYDYTIFVVSRDGSAIGLLAARIVEHAGARAMRIVDLLIGPQDVAALGAPLRGALRSAGCEYADLLQSGLEVAALQSAGFDTVTPESGLVVPNYFEPFVRQNVTITACVRSSGTPFVVCKGDGDQDRPNLP